MYLQVIEHSKLLHFVFKTQSPEIRLYLDDVFSREFLKKDARLFEIKKGRLHELNDCLEKVKVNYSNVLRNCPIPFSFFLSKNPEDLSKVKIPLRAGKIYLLDNLKRDVDSEFKEVPLFHGLQRWYDLIELVLPSTVDPKMDFFFKDIFWTGKEKFCFFCKSTWHPLENCPALAEPEARKLFIDLINTSFSKLSQILWKGISEENFVKEKLKYFYIRHFYLLPEFLKILFFKADEVKHWAQFRPEIEPPVRGGDIGIGLDSLIKKRLDIAEKKFKSAGEEDYKASLGLCYVNILKKDFKQAIYFVENAFEKSITPFLKSYALFLKGYIAEFAGDELVAEELYKEALKIDSSCLPAQYHLNLLLYRQTEDFRVIKPLLENIYGIYLAYLEPFFIKDQKQLEELVYQRLNQKREEVSKRLKEVEDKFHLLKEIMSEKEIESYEQQIKTLREYIYEGGLKKIERASELSLELNFELQGYIFNKIRLIQNKVQNLQQDYETLRSFWTSYPYKREDSFFGDTLKEIYHVISDTNRKLKSRDLSKFIKLILKELEGAQKRIEKLKKAKEELNKKWIFRKRVYEFSKNFIILESLLTIFYTGGHFLSVFKGFENVLSFGSFFFISLVFLIFCLLSAYLKHYE